MKTSQKIFVGILVLIVVISVFAVVDRMLTLESEVQENQSKRWSYIFERWRRSGGDVTPDENDYMQLQLEDLMQGNIFRYSIFRWDRSYLTVKANWAYELKPTALLYTEFRDLGCLTSKDTRILDGVMGEAMFYFKGNGGNFLEESELKGIAFRFEPDTDLDSWYQTQYDKLVALYGQPQQTGSDEQYPRQSRWEAEETSLELLVQVIEKENPAVIIRVSTR